MTSWVPLPFMQGSIMKHRRYFFTFGIPGNFFSTSIWLSSYDFIVSPQLHGQTVLLLLLMAQKGDTVNHFYLFLQITHSCCHQTAS